MIAAIDLGAVSAIAGLLLAILAAVLRLVVVAARLAQRVEDHTAAIDKNARHVDSVIEISWQLIWRMQTVEDFLHDHHGYRPPRSFPQPQT